MLGQGGQRPDQDFVILVWPVRADREDELPGQPVTMPGRGDRVGGDGDEWPDVHAVRHQSEMRGGGIVLADSGQAHLRRRRGRRRSPEHGPGRQLQPGLAMPAAGEAQIALDRAVMNGHHQRARPDDGGERRVRRVQRRRPGRADQPGQLPAAVHRAQRDVGVDHLGVRRQFRQREQLGPAGVDEHAQGQSVIGRAHVRGQLHHRTGDAVRPRQPVHARVDENRATTASHMSAPLLRWAPPRAGLGQTAARTWQPTSAARRLLCPYH